MLVISRFEVIFNRETNILCIESKQISVCPFCAGDLVVRDSKKRGVINSEGEKQVFSLRRLKCKDCNTLHIELPGFIQPFKHYASDVIESVLDERTDDCPAEESTMKRWQKWFASILPHIKGALTAIKMEFFNVNINLLDYADIVEYIRSSGAGWLRRLMQMLVNSGSRLVAES